MEGGADGQSWRPPGLLRPQQGPSHSSPCLLPEASSQTSPCVPPAPSRPRFSLHHTLLPSLGPFGPDVCSVRACALTLGSAGPAPSCPHVNAVTPASLPGTLSAAQLHRAPSYCPRPVPYLLSPEMTRRSPTLTLLLIFLKVRASQLEENSHTFPLLPLQLHLVTKWKYRFDCN